MYLNILSNIIQLFCALLNIIPALGQIPALPIPGGVPNIPNIPKPPPPVPDVSDPNAAIANASNNIPNLPVNVQNATDLANLGNVSNLSNLSLNALPVPAYGEVLKAYMERNNSDAVKSIFALTGGAALNGLPTGALGNTSGIDVNNVVNTASLVANENTVNMVAGVASSAASGDTQAIQGQVGNLTGTVGGVANNSALESLPVGGDAVGGIAGNVGNVGQVGGGVANTSVITGAVGGVTNNSALGSLPVGGDAVGGVAGNVGNVGQVTNSSSIPSVPVNISEFSGNPTEVASFITKNIPGGASAPSFENATMIIRDVSAGNGSGIVQPKESIADCKVLTEMAQVSNGTVNPAGNYTVVITELADGTVVEVKNSTSEAAPSGFTYIVYNNAPASKPLIICLETVECSQLLLQILFDASQGNACV